MTKEFSISSSVNFDAALRERADEIKANATADNTTGFIAVNKGFFEEKMTKVVSIEEYQKMMAERDLNINAANLAFTELSVQAMHQNKDLQRTEFLMPTIGRGSMEGAIQREYTRPDKETGQTVHGYGKLAAVVFNDFSSRGKGELKSIKRHLGEIANANLSD